MNGSIIKIVTKESAYAGVVDSQVIGVFEKEKISEVLEHVKKRMLEDGWKLSKETKDCCDTELEFEKEGLPMTYVRTKGYIFNELNL